MSDGDGYPTEDELQTVREWPMDSGLVKWFDFIEQIWWMADWGWRRRGKTYRISTGGWSGNEDVIEAMQGNTMGWMLCWESSRRGGHYVFRVPRLIP